MKCQHLIDEGKLPGRVATADISTHANNSVNKLTAFSSRSHCKHCHRCILPWCEYFAAQLQVPVRSYLFGGLRNFPSHVCRSRDVLQSATSPLVQVIILCSLRLQQVSAFAACPGTAVYTLQVETRWSAETHPRAFTGRDAAFADIHGTTHSTHSNWESPAQHIQCGPAHSNSESSFKVEMHCPQPGEALLF
jgi:hypothetical protein